MQKNVGLKDKGKYDRTFEEIQEHYQLEKQLASRLRNSTKEERKYLYNSLYDELYSKITYLKNRKTQHQPEAIASIILQN